MAAEVTRTRANELARSLNLDMLKRAYQAGTTLSAYLEDQDPSDAPEYKEEKSDAFQRVMRSLNIKTRSSWEHGLAADEMSAFEKNEASKVAFSEWVSRTWRSVTLGKPYNTRAMYVSDDVGLGTYYNPWGDSTRPVQFDKQIAPAIPIAELIAITTPVDRDTYRAAYLIDDPTNQRMVRVGEGAEIPGAKLKEGERTVYLYKYGRKLTMTYEQMRRLRIDIVALHLQRMAVQAEIDKLSTILDVAINGDGNSGTSATVYNLTALDPAATPPKLTLTGWLTFKMKFANPYFMDLALAQEAVILQLMLLNTGSANIPLVVVQAVSGLGSVTAINPNLRDNVRVGWTSSAPANQIVGMDSRFAIERVVEIGATIQEVTRFITNQTEAMTMTETEGFRVIDPNATKILNLAA